MASSLLLKPQLGQVQLQLIIDACKLLVAAISRDADKSRLHKMRYFIVDLFGLAFVSFKCYIPTRSLKMKNFFKKIGASRKGVRFL